MTIAVWQKQEFENERSIPHLKARLIYQKSKDEQKIYCQMEFETPYPVAKKDGVVVQRYGDKVICYYEVPDGQYRTLRVDHPERPIYGCTTRYNRKDNPTPFFFEPTFNMDIEVREGYVYTPGSERR